MASGPQLPCWIVLTFSCFVCFLQWFLWCLLSLLCFLYKYFSLSFLKWFRIFLQFLSWVLQVLFHILLLSTVTHCCLGHLVLCSYFVFFGTVIASLSFLVYFCFFSILYSLLWAALLWWIFIFYGEVKLIFIHPFLMVSLCWGRCDAFLVTYV